MSRFTESRKAFERVGEDPGELSERRRLDYHIVRLVRLIGTIPLSQHMSDSEAFDVRDSIGALHELVSKYRE